MGGFLDFGLKAPPPPRIFSPGVRLEGHQATMWLKLALMISIFVALLVFATRAAIRQNEAPRKTDEEANK